MFRKASLEFANLLNEANMSTVKAVSAREVRSRATLFSWQQGQQDLGHIFVGFLCLSKPKDEAKHDLSRHSVQGIIFRNEPSKREGVRCRG